MEISTNTLIALLASLSALGTFIWGIYAYVQKNKKEQEARILEFLAQKVNLSLDNMEERIQTAYDNGETLIKNNYKHMTRVEEDFGSRLEELSKRVRLVEQRAVPEQRVKDMLEPVEADVADLKQEMERGFSEMKGDNNKTIDAINNLAICLGELRGELRGSGLINSRGD